MQLLAEKGSASDPPVVLAEQLLKENVFNEILDGVGLFFQICQMLNLLYRLISTIMKIPIFKLFLCVKGQKKY